MISNEKLSKIAFLVVFALCGLLLTGCNQGTSVSQNMTLKGVSFSPRSNSAADFTSFFSKAELAGDVVSWVGDWNTLADTTSAPYAITGLASSYHLEPVVVVGVTTNGNRQLIRPLTPGNINVYLQSLTTFLTKYPIRYLGIGVEDNLLARSSASDFDQFVSLFNQAVEKVKQVSPSTQVFTVFQLEQMKGLRGGLFGGKNDTNDNDWDLIKRFDQADLIGFTTYPGLIYKDPAEIPDNYYSEIASHTGKPVMFSEMGWFRAGPVGWESSEAEQADFVTRFNQLTTQLSPTIKIWSFLFDQQAPAPFDSMGLLAKSEDTSPAWQAWAGK